MVRETQRRSIRRESEGPAPEREGASQSPKGGERGLSSNSLLALPLGLSSCFARSLWHSLPGQEGNGIHLLVDCSRLIVCAIQLFFCPSLSL